MTDYNALLTRYGELFPGEKDSLKQFCRFLSAKTSDAERVDRNSFHGHITASCLVVEVDAGPRRMLLLKHPRYNEYLQPGGHFEKAEESTLDVATRKLYGETHYGPDHLHYSPYDYNHLVPIDIDSHHIAAAGTEKNHVHHDFRYVYTIDAHDVRRADEEGKYRWFELEELYTWTTFLRLCRKLQQALSRDSARRRFYIDLASTLRPKKRFSTVIVTHVLPDSIDFLEALKHSTNLLGIIPKPKSLHQKTKDKLIASGFPIIETSRERLVSELPGLLRSANEPTVLLDIGGWFVPALDLPETDRKNVIGIVEDTRNGQNKYEDYRRRFGKFPVPVVSVAESKLKANEDFLVGKSVVFSADAVLRECGLVMEYLECGIVGYGKIGKSIAHHLRQRGIRPIVVEKNILRCVEAYNTSCTVRDRDWVNRNTDVIFCATGKQATDIIDFRGLRSGAFVFSVTSSDDEFDLTLFEGEGEFIPTIVSTHVRRYDSNHNHFYLVNGGNAVNFLHDAVLWEFIQLVRGGIFIAARNLADASASADVDQIGELTDEDQAKVAKLWTKSVLLGVRLEAE